MKDKDNQNGFSPKKVSSEKLIKSLTAAPTGISESDYLAEQASDEYEYLHGTNRYDDLFLQALHDHTQGRIPKDEEGTFKHPTTHALHIGIESILKGRPSVEFLKFLLEIAEVAESRDVLQLVFPDTYKKIKSGRIETTKLYAEIANAFREHLRVYQSSAQRHVLVGKNEKARRMRKIDYAEAKGLFKNSGRYEPKTVDRALAEHGLDWHAYSVSVALGS